MKRHLQAEIEGLKKKILFIGAMVEEALAKAVKAVLDRDAALARSVIENDQEVDRMEVELEEECLKVLALHQPVAIDLRFIVAILKINSDLERIGDLAVNIAKRVCTLAKLEKPASSFDFSAMSQRTIAMLKKALDSLVNMDPELAREVRAEDDEVDRMKRQIVSRIKGAIAEQPEHTESYLQFMSIARHLERVADHASNISDDVIYLMEGEIVRHRTNQES